MVQGHSTKAGREKGHLEWYFQKRSWTRKWKRLEVVCWGSWIFCAHTLSASCHLNESTWPYINHSELYKHSYHRKFIKVVMRLRLYSCISCLLRSSNYVYQQNNNEKNDTMSFHSTTVYGSDPLQDPTTSLTSLLHRSSEITWILPVPTPVLRPHTWETANSSNSTNDARDKIKSSSY